MGTEDRLAALEPQLARLAIVEQMWRYSRGVDRHDNGLLEAVFWPDCEISYTNLFTGDRAAFLAWANPHHEDAYLNHQHHTTAHIIDLDGDTASAEHYCIVFLQRHDGTVLLSSGRYLQQWERRSGPGGVSEWRILVREFLPEISCPSLLGGMARAEWTPASLREAYGATAVASPQGAWAPYPPSGPGRWDARDLAYRRPLGRRAERSDLDAWNEG